MHSFEPGFQLKCEINGCSSRTFTNYRSYRQHVRRRHSDIFAAEEEEDDDDEQYDASELLETEEAGTVEIPSVDLKRNDALFLLKMKEINRVSQKALDDIVGDVTELFQARLLQLKEDLLAELGPESTDSITAKIDGVVEPFKGLQSQRLQENYFKSELHLQVKCC